ncbi:hypothetical protein [Hydrocarboniclastica marina]|uniref:Uncharacterized protein n=1 Tax=Hydrocarboniclastica marina TaxID=2259620 RepID=A0A4P7XGM4_9ALTE|nr:hypothetical protein [Hydrocarboniclastica marina]MAL98663.1 hypothetical protein [Alteromonadaceae bacterium]QCF25594.1 hypothetical protein soil367_06495 [Hydrocarboniclastica marina]
MMMIYRNYCPRIAAQIILKPVAQYGSTGASVGSAWYLATTTGRVAGQDWTGFNANRQSGRPACSLRLLASQLNAKI